VHCLLGAPDIAVAAIALRSVSSASNALMRLCNSEWSFTMKYLNLRKTLNAVALVGTTIASTTALAVPWQGGYGMMDGYGDGWMGGHGGIWGPILLVVVVAGLVAWIVAQKRK
jgi:hypothetical protein